MALLEMFAQLDNQCLFCYSGQILVYDNQFFLGRYLLDGFDHLPDIRRTVVIMYLCTPKGLESLS